MRRKKPPDDNFKFSNEKIKLWKQIGRKNRKRLKQEKSNAFEEKIIIEVEKVNSKIEDEEQKCRTLIKEVDQQLTLSGQIIDMVEKDFGAVFTEDERKDSRYSFNTTEGEGISHAGLGYNTLITSNNQKVQGEGICWSKHFESAIQRIGLEAVESSTILLSREKKFNGQPEKIIETSKKKSLYFLNVK
jgi:hypothetical protein